MQAWAALKYHFERLYYKRFGYPVVSCGCADAPKRALLAYLSQGMKWRNNDPRFGWHQNLRQSRELACLLAARGFGVDVIQYDDSHYVPSCRYDLVICHPGVVSERIQLLPKTGVRICLRTGRYAAFVEFAMAERLARIRKSRGWVPVWSGMGETEDVYRGYDTIACFDGDGTSAATFSSVGLPVFSFRNYANPTIQYVEKDFSKARSGFLYMAGHLHVLKGLDWLIESFANTPNRDLYICGMESPDFHRIYAMELALPNIHVMGRVDLGSSCFRRLCQNAAWYVSPSASDGCQGTALDMMAAGLIPILSGACGINLDGSGIMLEPCTPEFLDGVLEVASNMPVDELRKLSGQARMRVAAHYAPRHFLQDWNHILDQIGV